MATRSLNVVITGDARSLNRTLGSVDKQTGRVEGRLKRFSGAAATALKGVGLAAAGGMTLGLKTAIDTATDTAESLSKNEVLFGRHAAAIERFSQTSARSFGISRREALAATGTFGNLFRALEIGPAKASQMSVSLTKLAADLASFNNASPEEALEAIRSGLVGETEPLRRFGVNLNDATLRAEALRLGLVKTTKDALQPQTRALAVNSLIFRQTQKAQGDFARTSGGLANQQRILKAQLSDVAGEIGTRLLPFVTRVAGAVNRFIKEMQTGRGAGGRFADTMRDVGERIGEVVRVIARVAGWLKDHPALLATAGVAWVAYKSAALVQIGLVRAGALGLFGTSVRARMAASAASAGTATGRSFATKAAGAAAAGVAGWQIGKWIRDHVPAVRTAGDFIGRQLGEAIWGATKTQDLMDRALDVANREIGRRTPGRADRRSSGPGARTSAVAGAARGWRPSFAQQVAESDVLVAQTGLNVGGVMPLRDDHVKALQKRSNLLGRRLSRVRGRMKQLRAFLRRRQTKAKRRKYAQELLRLTLEESALVAEVNAIAGTIVDITAEAAPETADAGGAVGGEAAPDVGGDTGGAVDAAPTVDPALEEANRLQQEANNRMKALEDELKRNREFAGSVTATQLGSYMRAFADWVDGEIYGTIERRAALAGAGSVYRA